MFLEYNYIFECDDKIADNIIALNNKGYITDFCCQGHDKDIIVEVNQDSGKVEYKEEKRYIGAYVLFTRSTSMDITIRNLGKPKNWNCEKTYDHEFDNVLSYVIRRHYTENEIKKYTIDELVDMSMNELKEWIDELPEIKLPFKYNSGNEILRKI